MGFKNIREPGGIPFNKLHVQIHIPNDDQISERLAVISSWKIEYVDGTSFPEISKVKSLNARSTDSWVITLASDVIGEKETYIYVKLKNGEFSEPHKFNTPPEFIKRRD